MYEVYQGFDDACGYDAEVIEKVDTELEAIALVEELQQAEIEEFDEIVNSYWYEEA